MHLKDLNHSLKLAQISEENSNIGRFQGSQFWECEREFPINQYQSLMFCLSAFHPHRPMNFDHWSEINFYKYIQIRYGPFLDWAVLVMAKAKEIRHHRLLLTVHIILSTRILKATYTAHAAPLLLHHLGTCSSRCLLHHQQWLEAYAMVRYWKKVCKLPFSTDNLYVCGYH